MATPSTGLPFGSVMRPLIVELAAVVAEAVTAAENSDVFPEGSVAVAVMFVPGDTTWTIAALKLPLHAPLVVVLVEPRKVLPWLPDEFPKNSTLKVVLALELSVPATVMLDPFVPAAVSTGKFWKLFPPESPSQLS